jgi:hypothetical protein
MAEKPKCKICGVAHWAYEPHVWKGEKCRTATSNALSAGEPNLDSSEQEASSSSLMQPSGTQNSKSSALIARKGRPLNSQRHLTNEAQKPWEALGMCRATWYRRQKDKQQQGDKG